MRIMWLYGCFNKTYYPSMKYFIRHLCMHNFQNYSSVKILTRNELRLSSIPDSFRNRLSRYFASTCESDKTNGITENTVSYFLNKWYKCFQENQVSEAKLSIQFILQHLLGLRYASELTAVLDQKLNCEQETLLNRLCTCRLSGMPVQYIIGEWDFRDLTIKLRPPVFIPRPETEELVEIVIKKFENRQLNVLDIGCGSGVITLSLLHQLPQVNCTALDQSKAACLLTLENAHCLNLQDRLQIFHGKITDEGLSGYNPKEKFDLIISNPPYVPQEELFQLQPEIKVYEDLRALSGGQEGMEIIKHILNYAPRILSSNGCVFLEVNPNHPFLIQEYINNNNIQLHFLKTYKDFSGKDRFVELQSKPCSP